MMDAFIAFLLVAQIGILLGIAGEVVQIKDFIRAPRSSSKRKKKK